MPNQTNAAKSNFFQNHRAEYEKSESDLQHLTTVERLKKESVNTGKQTRYSYLEII